MRSMSRRVLLLCLIVGAGCRPVADAPDGETGSTVHSDQATRSVFAAPSTDVSDSTVEGYGDRPDGTIRFATFNVGMYGKSADELLKLLGQGTWTKGKRVAEIIQRVRPDVLLLNEFDYDSDSGAREILLDRYLGVSQNGQAPITYSHSYVARVNTGEPSGMDLNQDGRSDGAADGFGYGVYPGQYGMVVLSRFPMDRKSVRTFQHFLWKDMPDALQPIDPASKQPYYPAEVWEKLRLSSKSHWDIPMDVAGTTVHFLVCHPTPPVFDGPEDRNGKRNHDEIRFWADYIDPERNGYIYDDQGLRGGLSVADHFVIAGDLNSDPHDGDSHSAAIGQLLEHRLISSAPVPSGQGGGVASSQADGMANLLHRGDPRHDTGDFRDADSGNLRVDYVLPGASLSCVGGGVFWPAPDSPLAPLVLASDHRLVWMDVRLPNG